MPFTINTALCALAIWASWRILYRPMPKEPEEASAFLPFIILMGKMALWFGVALIGLSVLSTLAAYFYYLYLRSNKGYKLQVAFHTDTHRGRSNRLYLDARLDGVFRPILGFVRGRLYYDDNVMTERFSLLSNKRREQSLRREAITGRSRLYLPDIKEYDLKGGFVYFQDMLHLFSFAAAQPVAGHFYQPPVLMASADAEVYPRKTETLDVRIEQLRRVEGEFLNYKDFEAGDDVRRIVWKVYAKNRELVVRTPELFEPYASHLYFYASFRAAVKAQWAGSGYMKEMLNYYKNCVWTVYDALSRKEWNMRYVPDQLLALPEQLSDEERAARIISNSAWQSDKAVSQYFNTRTGSVLCISSLTDVQDLANMLERCDGSVVVYFVCVSNALKHFAPLNWLGRLLFMPPQDRLTRLRTSWSFSPVRMQVHKREKEIWELLGKSSVLWAEL